MSGTAAIRERIKRAAKDTRLLLLPELAAALRDLVPVLDQVDDLAARVARLESQESAPAAHREQQR